MSEYLWVATLTKNQMNRTLRDVLASVLDERDPAL